MGYAIINISSGETIEGSGAQVSEISNNSTVVQITEIGQEPALEEIVPDGVSEKTDKPEEAVIRKDILDKANRATAS